MGLNGNELGRLAAPTQGNLVICILQRPAAKLHSFDRSIIRRVEDKECLSVQYPLVSSF